MKNLQMDKKDNKTESKCPYFKKCGGCRYINGSYEEQLKLKQKQVSVALKEITEAYENCEEELLFLLVLLSYLSELQS